MRMLPLRIAPCVFVCRRVDPLISFYSTRSNRNQLGHVSSSPHAASPSETKEKKEKKPTSHFASLIQDLKRHATSFMYKDQQSIRVCVCVFDISSSFFFNWWSPCNRIGIISSFLPSQQSTARVAAAIDHGSAVQFNNKSKKLFVAICNVIIMESYWRLAHSAQCAILKSLLHCSERRREQSISITNNYNNNNNKTMPRGKKLSWLDVSLFKAQWEQLPNQETVIDRISVRLAHCSTGYNLSPPFGIAAFAPQCTHTLKTHSLLTLSLSTLSGFLQPPATSHRFASLHCPAPGCCPASLIQVASF